MNTDNALGAEILNIDIGDMTVSVFKYGHVLEKSVADCSDSHFHTAYEFQFIESGSITLEDESKKYTATAGECIIIPPGTFHFNKAGGNFSRYTLTFSITQNDKGSPEFSEYCYYSRILKSIKGICVYKSDAVADSMKKLTAQSFEPRQERLHLIKLYTGAMLIELMQFIRTVSAPTGGDLRTDDGILLSPEDERIKFIIENCIQKYFATDDTTMRIAQALNMSSRNCARIINRLFCKNISDMVINQRMHLARTLILKTDRQINDIAEATGYKTYVAFFTAFKKYYGISPARLRDHQTRTPSI